MNANDEMISVPDRYYHKFWKNMLRQNLVDEHSYLFW